MMAAETMSEHLIERLPRVRGRLIAGAELSKLTWFRVGGPAEVLYRPADEADLAAFLKGLPDDVAITVIGVGSNLLVRDGGVPGVVIRLGDPFAHVRTEGEEIVAGGGASNLRIANAARDAGIAGLEFLSGIPGSLGGSLRMNAGAYGTETADITVSVSALDQHGERREIPVERMQFSYRHSNIDHGLIFVAARLHGHKGDYDQIAKRMGEIQAEREASQPIKTPTGGSTFINPPGHRAWELIDRAGCRGLKRGGAMVSEKHANFLINTGDATAADLEGLGEEVRRRVKLQSGVTLEWEIQRIGVTLDGGRS